MRADSINETARMARATNSLFLFVALYLALTLLSTTDENLLRNGQVVLPQVGAGISIVQSYVLAPVVFLYLHGQALVLLTVLVRKVHTFEAVLRDDLPGRLLSFPNRQDRIASTAKWLRSHRRRTWRRPHQYSSNQADRLVISPFHRRDISDTNFREEPGSCARTMPGSCDRVLTRRSVDDNTWIDVHRNTGTHLSQSDSQEE